MPSIEDHQAYVRNMYADLSDALTEMAIERPSDAHAFLALFLLRRSQQATSKRILETLDNNLEKSQRDGLDNEQKVHSSGWDRKRVRKLFDTLDISGDGRLRYYELRGGMEARREEWGIPAGYARQFWLEANIDGDSFLTFDEFWNMLIGNSPSSSRHEHGETDDRHLEEDREHEDTEAQDTQKQPKTEWMMECVRKAFDSLDINNDGKLRFSELKMGLVHHQAEWDIDPEWADAFWDAANVNNDAFLTFDEFWQFLSAPEEFAPIDEGEWGADQKHTATLGAGNQLEELAVEKSINKPLGAGNQLEELAVEKSINERAQEGFLEQSSHAVESKEKHESLSLTSELGRMERHRRAQLLFDQLDISQDGFLTLNELISAIRSNPEWYVNESQAVDFFKQVDINQDEFITFDLWWEFLSGEQVYPPAFFTQNGWNIQLAHKIFDLIDIRQDGMVFLQEFLEAIQMHPEWGLQPTEVIDFFEVADTDHSEFITFDEFWSCIEKFSGASSNQVSCQYCLDSGHDWRDLPCACPRGAHTETKAKSQPRVQIATADKHNVEHVDLSLESSNENAESHTSPDELIKGCTREKAQRAFDAMDIRGDGLLFVYELLEASRRNSNQWNISEDDIIHFFRKVDVDQDEIITFEEYWQFLSSTNQGTEHARVDAKKEENLPEAHEANGRVNGIDHEQDQLKTKVRAMFDELDTSGDGRLRYYEVKAGFKKHQDDWNLPDGYAANFWQVADADDSGFLTFQEFWDVLTGKTKPEEKINGWTKSEAQKAFQEMDITRNGKLKLYELRRGFKEHAHQWKVPSNKGFAERFFRAADVNGDKFVDFEEWWGLLTFQRNQPVSKESEETRDAKAPVASVSVDPGANQGLGVSSLGGEITNDIETGLLRITSVDIEQGMVQSFVTIGDQIKAIDGKTFTTVSGAIEYVETCGKVPGELITLDLMRGHDQREEQVDVELGSTSIKLSQVRDRRHDLGLEELEFELYNPTDAEDELYESTPTVGFKIADLKSADGIKVTTVHENGPAWFAGFQKGDIVIATEETPTNNRKEFIKILKTFHVGDRIRLLVIRGGVDDNLILTLELGINTKDVDSVEKVRSLRLIAGWTSRIHQVTEEEDEEEEDDL